MFSQVIALLNYTPFQRLLHVKPICFLLQITYYNGHWQVMGIEILYLPCWLKSPARKKPVSHVRSVVITASNISPSHHTEKSRLYFYRMLNWSIKQVQAEWLSYIIL